MLGEEAEARKTSLYCLGLCFWMLFMEFGSSLYPFPSSPAHLHDYTAHSGPTTHTLIRMFRFGRALCPASSDSMPVPFLSLEVVVGVVVEWLTPLSSTLVLVWLFQFHMNWSVLE